MIWYITDDITSEEDTSNGDHSYAANPTASIFINVLLAVCSFTSELQLSVNLLLV